MTVGAGPGAGAGASTVPDSSSSSSFDSDGGPAGRGARAPGSGATTLPLTEPASISIIKTPELEKTTTSANILPERAGFDYPLSTTKG